VLSGISCLSTGGSGSFCAAVDHVGNFLTTSNEWSSFQSTKMGDKLTGVSCTSTTFCVAVASTGKASIWQNGAITTTSVDTKGLNSVSCALLSSTPVCWAVDEMGKGVYYNGSTWSSPSNADGGGVESLKSVSSLVPSTTLSCSVVDAGGNVVTYNGTSRSSQTNLSGTKSLKAVSCTSATVCVAFDSAGYVYTTTNDWASGSILSKKVMGGADSVSCVNTTDCQATNSVEKVYWTTNQFFSASSKRIDTHTINSISCWGTTNCSAVDSGGQAVTSDNDWSSTSVVQID
jgi:hypothetical protein